MAIFSRSSAFSRVTALAAQRPVHAAFAWLHGNPKTIMDWQASWWPFRRRPSANRPVQSGWRPALAEAGLSQVHTDASATSSAFCLPPTFPGEHRSNRRALRASRYRFSPGNAAESGGERRPPGSSRRLRQRRRRWSECWPSPTRWSRPKSNCPRRCFSWAMWAKRAKATCAACATSITRVALAGRIAAHIVLDGAGADSAVTQALGSRAFW
jgi:tripeptide aminopeptidase